MTATQNGAQVTSVNGQVASEHERLRARAAELAAQAPPLTDAQRERLALLLSSGHGNAA